VTRSAAGSIEISRTGQARLYAGLAAIAAGLAAAWAPPAHAEQRFDGTLRAVVTDDFASGTATTDYRLESNGRTSPLLPTGVVEADDGARVTVTGSREQGYVVGDVRARQAPARAVEGPRSLAVVLVNFSDDVREPWTRELVRSRLFTDANSTSAFFSEESYGRMSLVGRNDAGGDVFGWYTVPGVPDPCDHNSWTGSARAAAVADGRDLSAYDNVMFMIPRESCSWAGKGGLNGQTSWINGELSVRVTSHELGHNFGLHHANTLYCTVGETAVTLSDTCVGREYFDPWDAMGAYSTVRHNHGWNLERLGYLSLSNVRTIEASGRYQLRSALAESSEVTSLKIPRTRGPNGEVVDHLSLELRERGGVFEAFPSGDPAINGLSVRLTGVSDHPLSTYLLDARPGTADNFFDATLPPGQTFSQAGIDITLVAPASGGRATVDVTIPLPRDTEAPTAPAGLGAQRSADSVELAWASSSDNRGVSGYEVYRDGAVLGRNAAASFRDTSAGEGAHAYEVAALDEAGNMSPRSEPVVVPAVQAPAPAVQAPAPALQGPAIAPALTRDLAPPRVRLTSRRSGQRLLVTARAADAGGIARLALKIDGRRRKLVRGPRLRYAWSVRGVRRGGHRLAAVAVDRSGNRASRQSVFRLRR